MTKKEQNKWTRDDRERVEIYDWALDPDINPDFDRWLKELGGEPHPKNR